MIESKTKSKSQSKNKPKKQTPRLDFEKIIMELLDREGARTEEEIIEHFNYQANILTIKARIRDLAIREEIIYCPRSKTYRKNWR